MKIDSQQYNGACSCGREHKMETVFSLIESGCLKNANEYIRKFLPEGKIVTVYDENTYKATEGRHPNATAEVILNPENLHANEHGVDLLLERLPEDADILVAVGSGTIHDITRYCAYVKGLKFVSCPTAASVDGFCSSVAAMTWHGCKKTLTAVAPTIVLADTDIVKNAPIRLTRSGFGDMIGKYIALSDWKISSILTGEFYCERIADMTLNATKAVVASAKDIINGDEKAYENLMYGLLLSGLAMQMMGNSRPASGAEHHISHIIEMAPKPLGFSSEALHGEKVGVGTLLALREYKRLASEKTLNFKDYERYSDDFITELFGAETAPEIIKENEKDAADGVQGECIKAHWNDICAVIANIPSPEYLLELYAALDVKSTLTDIEVNEKNAATLLNYSPMVRNRLTLMRLRKCIY